MAMAVLRNVVLWLAALPIAGPVAAASFDCGKAQSRVEKVICASAELGALDERLAAAFRAIGPEPEGNEWGRRAPRVDDQRRWLREVRDRCADAPCLRAAYAARIHVLERWHEPAPADASVAGRYIVDHTVALVGEEMTRATVSDCLALESREDGSFRLSIESVQANAHLCSFEARVRADGSVLRVVPGSTSDDDDVDGPGCALAVRVENGELQVEDPDGACHRYCGARARLGGLRFPRSTKRPGPPTACMVFDE